MIPDHHSFVEDSPSEATFRSSLRALVEFHSAIGEQIDQMTADRAALDGFIQNLMVTAKIGRSAPVAGFHTMRVLTSDYLQSTEKLLLSYPHDYYLQTTRDLLQSLLAALNAIPGSGGRVQ